MKLFKKQIFIVSLILLFSKSFSSAQNWEWAAHLNGYYEDHGYSFAMDQNKNSYLIGYFKAGIGSGCIAPTLGPSEGFVAKFSSSGNYLWCTHFGGRSDDSGTSIVYDSTGALYLTGYFRDTAYFGIDTLISTSGTTVFLSKLDVNGNFIWTRIVGGPSGISSNAVNILDDGLVVCGGYYGSVLFEGTPITSAGDSDIFIAKYDFNGNFMWVSTGGGSGNDIANCLIPSANNNILVGCNFQSSATFNNQVVVSSGSSDVVILQLDSIGNINVLSSYGGAGIETIGDIKSDVAGNILTTGNFEDTW